MLEEIYDKIYAETEDVRESDHEAGSRLEALIENADLEGITQEEFADLVFKAYVMGEKKGFVSGLRFFAKLICNALS